MATKYWKASTASNFQTGSNWSDGAAPANGDTLVFNHLGTGNVTSGLSNTLTGVTVIIEMGYTGQIGVLDASTRTYLELDGGTIYIGRKSPQGAGSGPGLVMIRNIDGGSSTDMTINVLDSASSNSASTYYPPILIKGTGITLNVNGGNVGVNLIPGDTPPTTTQLDSIRINSSDGGVNPQVTVGGNASVTNVYASAGSFVCYSNSAITYAFFAGNSIAEFIGTGAVTTLEVGDSAVCYYSGTGTVTTANIRGAVLDLSRDARSKTVTTLNMYRGSTLNIDNGTPGSIVFSNPINYHDGVDGVTVVTPPQMKGSLTNI